MSSKTTLLTAVAVLLLGGSLFAHDLFLKIRSHFVEPGTEATLILYNGTFDQSLNVIDRDRMQDVKIVGPQAQVVRPDPSAWWDDLDATWIKVPTGESGTYVMGVSTLPRMIELSAADFDDYLVHDGVQDVREARQKQGAGEGPVRERYSKHVKALYQVGDTTSGSFQERLGYPIEIVPLQNPLALQVDDTLEVLVLRDGKPLANQLVYASYERHHVHDDQGGHIEAVQTRTDQQGIAPIKISKAARWYVRLIHMVECPDEEVDYESNWATLTFEVR